MLSKGTPGAVLGLLKLMGAIQGMHRGHYYQLLENTPKNKSYKMSPFFRVISGLFLIYIYIYMCMYLFYFFREGS